MSLAPSLKLTNLGNKFTVNSFFPYLRLTVKIFQFLRLSTKFLAVYAYRLTPLRPSFTRFAKKRTSRDMWSSWNYFRNNNGQRRYKERNKERYKKIKWRNSWCSFLVRPNSVLEISVSSQCVCRKQSIAFREDWTAMCKAPCRVWQGSSFGTNCRTTGALSLVFAQSA